MTNEVRKFSFSAQQVHEILASDKTIVGEKIEFKPYEKKSLIGKWNVCITEHPLIRLELHVAAGVPDDPRTYRAALVLEERIRGVDYSDIAIRRYYKEVLPKGWHQNILDPTLSADDRKQNRHEVLNDFAPVDLKDFLSKVCLLWNIKLPRREEDLL